MFPFNSFFHIFKVKNHSSYKQNILHSISNIDRPFKNTDISEYNSYISNTDWMLNLSINWFDLVFSNYDKKRCNDFLLKKYNKKNLKIDSSWFNQYYPNSGSEHFYHAHVEHDVVGIYYVELKDHSLRTILQHPSTSKEIIPKVNEGDILFFPGKVLHCSPKNFSKTRKTVIAFNISFF